MGRPFPVEIAESKEKLEKDLKQVRAASSKERLQMRQKLTPLLETITPETIASLTSYDFILKALFSAAL